MTTALVTGGAGFIGSHVADCCLRDGMRVIVLDDLSGGFRDNVPEEAVFVHGSVTDSGLLSELFSAHEFDFVYHLAAYAAEGLSHFIRNYNYRTNLLGSVNVINECVRARVKCLVFASSIAVYGANQVPMHESMIPQPEDPYGISKYAVELDLASARKQFGLDYIVFRPHNVYGERQNIGDKYRNVIGIFMNQILREEPLTVFGDGSQTRAFSYVDDVAPVIARSVSFEPAFGRVFNIGGDVPHTINQLVKVVSEAMEAEPAIRYLPARNEVKHAFASHEAAQRCFGVRSLTSLEDGIARMAAWARAVGARSTSTFTEIEIDEGLPQGW